MSEVLVNLDDEALAAAAEIYATTTPTDTINTALREAAARLRRARDPVDLLTAVAADRHRLGAPAL